MIQHCDMDILEVMDKLTRLLRENNGCPYPAIGKHHYGVRIECRTENRDSCSDWCCEIVEVTCAPPHEEMQTASKASGATLADAISMALEGLPQDSFPISSQ